jgi:hypothetical protein
MIIFLLIIGFFFLGVYLLYKSGEMPYSSKEEMVGLFGFIFTLIFGFFLFGSIIVIVSHINTKAALGHEQAQYAALMYKRDYIMNESNSKEIIDEIQEWNTNLIYKKGMSHNIWFNIYVYNFYDELDTIDYAEVEDYSQRTSNDRL